MRFDLRSGQSSGAARGVRLAYQRRARCKTNPVHGQPSGSICAGVETRMVTFEKGNSMSSFLSDPGAWSRLQFAFTVTYRYLFPQLTMAKDSGISYACLPIYFWPFSARACSCSSSAGVDIRRVSLGAVGLPRKNGHRSCVTH